jgi:hypothetical protein
MKYMILVVLFSAMVCFGQKASDPIARNIVTFTPEDSSDRKVYVPPVPACTVIVYPVIRENIYLGKGDKVRLIFRTKPKDSSSFTELWQWDYKQTEKDSSLLLIKATFIDK